MIENEKYAIPETFCPLPWQQIASLPTGQMQACTLSSQLQENVKFADYLNHPSMIQLRKDLASGVKSANCELCWKMEATGNNSLRKKQLSNILKSDGSYGLYLLIEESRKKKFLVDKLTKLDFRIGTLCNLKCRMCSATNSSKIWSEYENNKELLSPFSHLYFDAHKFYEGNRPLPSLEDLVSISFDLERISVSGGEPFLSTFLMDYLERIVELKLSKKIILKINSNGLVDSPRMLNIFKTFRRVEIYLSIDGVGPVFEYIRHPGKWADLQKNVLKLKDHFKTLGASKFRLLVAPTYQALNILNIKELILWCEEMNLEQTYFSKVNNPPYLSISVLPEKVRVLAASRLEAFSRERELSESLKQDLEYMINHLHTPVAFDPALFGDFLKYNQTLDKIRNESFARSCPDLHAILQDMATEENKNCRISG